MFHGKLKRETMQILFYLKIFVVFVTIFLLALVLFFRYSEINPELIYIFCFLLYDFPITGYLVIIHHLNYKIKNEDEIETTDDDLDDESGTQFDIDNESIFADLFLKRHSFRSSVQTSLKASMNSECNVDSAPPLLSSKDVNQRLTESQRSLKKYSKPILEKSPKGASTPPNEALSLQSVTDLMKQVNHKEDHSIGT